MKTGGTVTRFRAAALAVAVVVAMPVVLLVGASGTSAAERGGASGGTAPSSAVVTIEGGFTHFTFTPRTVTLAAGGQLEVVNDTISRHTFVSSDLGADGDPLFAVTIPPHKSRFVPVADLGGGSYSFYCTIHPAMTGTLVIDGPPDSGPITDVPDFEQPLVQPPRLTGSHIRIVARKTAVRVLPHGPKTPMWTFGGTFPGPTIVRNTGHDTHVTFVNHLPRAAGAITVHEHGGHQASADDGQPMSHLIKHGKSRTYDYPLTDGGRPLPSGLRLYHDHRMHETARNVWRGLAGMFLVQDPREDRLGLPHGRFEIPLSFTDRSFDSHNRLTDPFHHMDMTASSGTTGTKVLVNGRYAPYLKVKPALYRFQLLNSSLFSSYDFALSDGSTFTQVGTGNGLLPHPVSRQDILLGPAQRADVVVDFGKSRGANVLMTSLPSDDEPVGIGTRSSALMQFRVRGTARRNGRVPFRLAHIAPLPAGGKLAMTWTFGKSRDRHGSFWSINGKRFNPHRVDHRVTLGSVERWKLRNTSAITHFVHLHEEEWLTLRRDGHKPPPWERGYEDTWRLDPGESVVVAAQFTDFTGDFMVHCHMLDHEDDGMMATFRVMPRRLHPKGG